MWSAQDQHRLLETEIADRETLSTEVNDTMKWLQTVQSSLTDSPSTATETKVIDSQLQNQEVYFYYLFVTSFTK